MRRFSFLLGSFFKKKLDILFSMFLFLVLLLCGSRATTCKWMKKIQVAQKHFTPLISLLIAFVRFRVRWRIFLCAGKSMIFLSIISVDDLIFQNSAALCYNLNIKFTQIKTEILPTRNSFCNISYRSPPALPEGITIFYVGFVQR